MEKGENGAIHFAIHKKGLESYLQSHFWMKESQTVNSRLILLCNAKMSILGIYYYSYFYVIFLNSEKSITE